MKKLGIIDWGIGGIGIYKLFKERPQSVSVLYFSDTGVMPYGRMSRQQLAARLTAVIGFFKSKGVTHVAIGCNAASTAIPYLNIRGLQIEGVIETAIKSTAKLNPERLGLIGGRRTVVSGVYRNGFADRGMSVKQRIAQPLSGLIESGDVSSGVLRGECERILSPLKNCSHILLACTHYPAIINVLKDFVSPETKFIDPAAGLVDEIYKWGIPAGGDDIFLTSGDPGRMKSAAKAAFGVSLTVIRQIEI